MALKEFPGPVTSSLAVRNRASISFASMSCLRRPSSSTWSFSMAPLRSGSSLYFLTFWAKSSARFLSSAPMGAVWLSTSMLSLLASEGFCYCSRIPRAAS